LNQQLPAAVGPLAPLGSLVIYAGRIDHRAKTAIAIRPYP
jgi:hypothetical protein